MTEDQIVRKIAVIFVTDVVSFSTLMEKNENSTLISLRACRQIMNQLFKKYDARIFNTAGDSVLAEFQSAVSAVICAAEFQQMISKRNLSVSKDFQMQFRVGLNVGDVIAEGTNLYGEGGGLQYKYIFYTVSIGCTADNVVTEMQASSK